MMASEIQVSDLQHYQIVAGLDEVGRGPLAGPVYAAAVVLDPRVTIFGLKDSKQLTERRRNLLDEEIRQKARAFCVARAEVAEIDELNILQASLLAMQRAYNGLELDVGIDLALVDGNRLPDLPCPAEAIVKGDSKLDAIKAASIVAKVARDQEMRRLSKLYPQYGFGRHKGYPTQDHIAALETHGPCPIHRMSFAPCRKAAKAG